MVYFHSLPLFLAYFVVAIALVSLFIVVYTRITPHSEFDLIVKGNRSAAVQFVGAFMGFCIPLASLLVHSVNFADLFLWSIVAIAVQSLTFFVSTLIMKTNTKIVDDVLSVGIVIGGISIGVGILQAACMVP